MRTESTATRNHGLRPAAILVAAAVLSGSGARAAPAGAGEVTVRLTVPEAGGCPSLAQVEAALHAAAPSVRLQSLSLPGVHTVDASVVDLGPRFVVTADSTRREVADGAYRCEERARTAAIFILITLDLPTMEMPPSPAPPPATAAAPTAGGPVEAHPPDAPRAPPDHRAADAPPPSTPPRPPRPPRLQLETALLGRVGAGSDGRLQNSGGAALRLAAGAVGFPLAFTAGLAVWSLPSDFVPGQRVGPASPILDAGLRLGWTGRWVSISGDVGGGLAFTHLVLEGSDGVTFRTRADDWFEGVVRLAFRVGVHPFSREEFFASLEATVVPVPLVVPTGATASFTAPQAWIGLQIGVATDFLKPGWGPRPFFP